MTDKLVSLSHETRRYLKTHIVRTVSASNEPTEDNN